MMQSSNSRPKPLGWVWVNCPRSLVTAGLVQALEMKALVHIGQEPPEETPSSVILWANGQEDLSDDIERHRELSSDALPILVFGSHLDLPLAWEALMAGASGFLHAGMTPDQLLRAVTVAAKGELVAPRELLRHVIREEQSADLNILSPRQREILELVAEGLSNADIARRLYLTESTIKQHLRAAYKLLGVRSRTGAAKLIRDSG